jgi:predicted MPP superfamily phosphohydrolase
MNHPNSGIDPRIPQTQSSAFTRRRFLGASTLAASAYCFDAAASGALGVATVTRYRVTPKGWPDGLRLRIAVIADLHACHPWMGVGQIERIVHATNSLGVDMVALLGDYVAGHRKVTRAMRDDELARPLGALKAPFGVHAVLGNHDWWDDERAQYTSRGPISARLALERAGIPVYENDAVRLEKSGRPFWVAGLADQEAMLSHRFRRGIRGGKNDLSATLDQVHDDAPIVLLAHEPDIFPTVPDRVALTLSGHTHGGQVRILGHAPVAPSALSHVYNYGHYVEGDRNLVVSGGLGCSGLPIRLGIPPEIVLVEIGAAQPVA